MTEVVNQCEQGDRTQRVLALSASPPITHRRQAEEKGTLLLLSTSPPLMIFFSQKQNRLSLSPTPTHTHSLRYSLVVIFRETF